MLIIPTSQRKELQVRAQTLSPVVIISQNGLSEPVLNEIAQSLESHELIKIRVFNDDRKERENYLALICETLEAAPVQHIGKMLVIFRPAKNKSKTPSSAPKKNRSGKRLSKRDFQGSTAK